MIKDILVFSLTSNNRLTEKVCEILGIEHSEAEVIHFADGECLATSKVDVRGKKIYIIQSTSAPVNDRIMELLIFIDGIRRANCKEITLIIPYYGYSRQDRIAHINEPVSAKMVADLFSNAHVSRVVTIELHTPQIQGFFSIPVDNLSPTFVYSKYLNNKFNSLGYKNSDIAIVSPDHGAMYRARDLANAIPDSSIVIIDKRRPRPNVAEVTNIIGDIKGKVCIMVDDIIDTGGTILAGAKTLFDRGAKEIYICACHAILSNNALEKINKADYVKEVLVTDTIEHPNFQASDKITVASVAEMIADVIKSHESHEKIKDKYTRFN